MLLSERAIEIRKQFFPMNFGNGVYAQCVNEEIFREFIGDNFSAVFGKSGVSNIEIPEFRQEFTARTTENFAQVHKEFIMFYDANTPIGWSTGEGQDSITFYMRNTGILPDFQNKGIYKTFLALYLSYLSEIGYERVSSKHKPFNQSVLVAKLKAGFFVDGMEIEERWGALVKLVYFTQEYRREKFKNRFE